VNQDEYLKEISERLEEIKKNDEIKGIVKTQREELFDIFKTEDDLCMELEKNAAHQG